MPSSLWITQLGISTTAAPYIAFAGRAQGSTLLISGFFRIIEKPSLKSTKMLLILSIILESPCPGLVLGLPTFPVSFACVWDTLMKYKLRAEKRSVNALSTSKPVIPISEAIMPAIIFAAAIMPSRPVFSNEFAVTIFFRSTNIGIYANSAG